MIGIIYKYTSPSGKIYVGQTMEEKRRRKTFLNLNKSYGGEKIDNARKKYTPNNFLYEVIHTEEFANKQEATLRLDVLEEFYIKYYNTYENGYNMTYGGYTNRGFKFSDEQRLQMSHSRLGRLGTPLTEEQKQNHSLLMKLKWETLEYRKIRECISKSPEHIQKKRDSVMGEKNGMFGKTHNQDSKQKMSESRFGEKNYWFGKQKDEDTCDKIKIALSKYHNTNKIADTTRKKISENCSMSVNQYNLAGDYIDTFASITKAGKELGIDSSCITKCCKGKRGTAGGFKWTYADPIVNDNIINIQSNVNEDWITTADAVALTGRCRNVLYYHIKHHGVPKKSVGRKILINKTALVELFNIKQSD